LCEKRFIVKRNLNDKEDVITNFYDLIVLINELW
jgi:hypothetical protein